MPKPTLSIIIISYNTRALTLACLASVFDQTDTPAQVIVVDNASTDGSAQAIAKAFPNVELIAETTNHGFAPAHEIATRAVEGDWILLLNPDTLILDHAIDKLMAFARHTPNAGIWGGRTLYPDGRLNATSCWRRMSTWNILCRLFGLTRLFPNSTMFNSESYANWPRDSEREVDIVTGCFLLIQRQSWQRLGGLDPDFKMYGEEADLCIRARRLGLRPRVTPNATIIHYGGASTVVSADRMVGVIKAKTELIKRHFPFGFRRLGQRMFCMFPWSRWVLFSAAAKLLNKDDHHTKAVAWSAVWKRRSEWKDGFQSS